MSDLTPTKYKSYISHGDQALKKRTLQKYGITNTPDAGDEVSKKILFLTLADIRKQIN